MENEYLPPEAKAMRESLQPLLDQIKAHCETHNLSYCRSFAGREASSQRWNAGSFGGGDTDGESPLPHELARRVFDGSACVVTPDGEAPLALAHDNPPLH